MIPNPLVWKLWKFFLWLIGGSTNKLALEDDLFWWKIKVGIFSSSFIDGVFWSFFLLEPVKNMRNILFLWFLWNCTHKKKSCFVEKFREIEQKKISEKFGIGGSDPTITLLALAFWVQILRRNQLHFKKVLLDSQ